MESEMPVVPIDEEEACMNIKTIEKTYRNMPRTLKKKLRQRLSMKNGFV
jgi:hypothetical protein